MASPKAVPAVPPTFHFKMRLVDGAGNAFADKDYQLWWGGIMVKEGKTDADGVVAADLDDRFDTGILDLGDRDAASKFVARLTIRIEGVQPAPPPPKPFSPPKKTRPHRPDPTAEYDGTDEDDPQPIFPAYPTRGQEDVPGWQRYQEEQKAWDAWWQRRKDRVDAAKKREREKEDRRELQKQQDKLRKDYRGQDQPESATPANAQPAPPMSDKDMQDLQERLQRVRDEGHAAKVLAYELSWRLRNLGYLPESSEPTFPPEGTALDRLLDALRRYAHKHGLSYPSLNDVLVGVGAPAIKALSEAIMKEHDG